MAPAPLCIDHNSCFILMLHFLAGDVGEGRWPDVPPRMTLTVFSEAPGEAAAQRATYAPPGTLLGSLRTTKLESNPQLPPPAPLPPASRGVPSLPAAPEPYFRRVAGASPQLVWCQGSVSNRGTGIVPRSIWGGRLGSSCHLPALASSEMFIILPNACTSIHIGSC